jgi:hypothetical protein
MELSNIGVVHTPWGGENTNDSFDIPNAQRFYNSASNGWEMCFCKFNDTADMIPGITETTVVYPAG